MSRASFPGFPREGIRFLADLARHNDRAWFQPRKDEFERSVKAPMLAFVAAIDESLKEIAPEYVTDPAKAITRIHRDVRFGKDKSPYRTDLGARFGRSGLGKGAEACGFYVSVSPKGVDVAGGSYALETPQVERLRKHVAAHAPAFRRLVEDEALTAAMGPLQGERLVRVPKGYDPDHPAADLLRLKQAYFYVTLPASLATTPRLLGEVTKRIRLVAPFVRSLEKAVGSR